MRRTRRPRFVLMNKMDDLNLHYRFLNWRRRIREIREVRAFRYQERFKHILVDGDTLSYHGNSGEVGCYVASRPLTKDSNYFEALQWPSQGPAVWVKVQLWGPDWLWH